MNAGVVEADAEAIAGAVAQATQLCEAALEEVQGATQKQQVCILCIYMYVCRLCVYEDERL